MKTLFIVLLACSICGVVISLIGMIMSKYEYKHIDKNFNKFLKYDKINHDYKDLNSDKAIEMFNREMDMVTRIYTRFNRYRIINNYRTSFKILLLSFLFTNITLLIVLFV